MPVIQHNAITNLLWPCFAVTVICGANSDIAYSQLNANFSVDVSSADDGIYTYSYTLVNDITSSQAINTLLLSTAIGAPVFDIIQPPGSWIVDFAPEENLYQIAFATGLSADGQNCNGPDDFEILPGQSAVFSISSPWTPAPQEFLIGQAGVDCLFVGDSLRRQIDAPSIPIDECDFDRDGDCDLRDIDDLAAAIVDGDSAMKFDLNLDSSVNFADLELFLSLTNRLNGDTDFNGKVEFADFLVISGSFSEVATWSLGDFDANGVVAFGDFLILSGNFGNSNARVAVSAPEPAAWGSSLFAVAIVFAAARIKHGRVNAALTYKL